MTDEPNLITEAAKHTSGGYSGQARAAGVNVRTVRHWEKAGRLPISCLAGLRGYHKSIARACGQKVTSKELLAWSRRAWDRYFADGGRD